MLARCPVHSITFFLKKKKKCSYLNCVHYERYWSVCGLQYIFQLLLIISCITTLYNFVCVLVTQDQLHVTPWTQHTKPLCPWDFPGKNIKVCRHSLLHGIFPTQGLTKVSCIAGRFFTVWAILYMTLYNFNGGKSVRNLWLNVWEMIPRKLQEKLYIIQRLFIAK